MNITVTLNRGISLRSVGPVHTAQRRNPTQERAYRRALRAAELAAWNAADPQAITRSSVPSASTERIESILYLLLVAAILTGLVMGTTGALEWPTHSETLKRLLHSMIP